MKQGLQIKTMSKLTPFLKIELFLKNKYLKWSHILQIGETQVIANWMIESEIDNSIPNN